MKPCYPTWIEWAVLAYSVWQSSDLQWANAPLIRGGGLALAFWCLPIVWNQLQAIRNEHPKGYTPLLLLAAMACGLLGSIGELNALRYLGLAFALAAMVPFSWPMIPWVASAATWMPAFGWIFRSLPVPFIHLYQFIGVFIGTGIMLIWQLKRRS